MTLFFIASGSDFVSSAETLFTDDGAQGGCGVFSLLAGKKPFSDGAVLEFLTVGADDAGSLGQGAECIGLRVYASRQDYELGGVLYDYGPKHPEAGARVVSQAAGTGEAYVSFDGALTGPPQAPELRGRLWVGPGSGAANHIGHYHAPRREFAPLPACNGEVMFKAACPEQVKDGGFCVGTRLATLRGEVRVEDLVVGDQIITRDSPSQKVQWVKHLCLTSAQLAQLEDLAPVKMESGALGHGAPEIETWVSPRQSVLVVGSDRATISGQDECFVRAQSLIGRDGVTQTAAKTVSYVQIGVKRQDAVLANGAWCETPLPKLRLLSESEGTPVKRASPVAKPRTKGSVLDGFVMAGRALLARETDGRLRLI